VGQGSPHGKAGEGACDPLCNPSYHLSHVPYDGRRGQRKEYIRYVELREKQRRALFKRLSAYNKIRAWLYNTIQKAYPELHLFKAKLQSNRYELDILGPDGNKVRRP
jgi:hypothetical protein